MRLAAIRQKPIRDALVRLRAAVLDLSVAGCHAEAAELGALIKRLEERLRAT